MVDRGELQAWRTPGGHRRIDAGSVERWLASRQGDRHPAATRMPQRRATDGDGRPRALLIEDSRHFQNLVRLLVTQQFPQLDLRLADDGIAGLAMAGQLQPDVLLVDILLPGIDGAALITGLRSHSTFSRTELIVVTSLAVDELVPYAVALHGVAVVHKPRLALDLPPLLGAALQRAAHRNSA
jgi:CheY-like chemotaxis protein